ncbi:hypothetical protein TSTA_031550 [Talaromyces stipitatus ATCC 10500]|uniref:Extracellular membrane protein CFEM domain-containing protein n=1 Tax=Talaromyces stipitatus (strain ATCC 10500 / CBS 375.48 / QM 6759 / NRRL 1006) TaxID=441959 RepID=B8M5K2_TALSN|nr:uncharacterized protein TSTA_031550 [Talaromyces stipitatus ATCC 10500]EED19896.1 hypothetical protein TSTA_031550 [Talaromyces stipitatus ATCC 10500]
MRSLVTLIAFAAAATAATSSLVAREDAQTCAMRTLLSSSACNTGDAACLCSDSARTAVMQEIKAACGAEQSDLTDSLASEACRMQKVRRATQPSATVVHMGLATPSSSPAGRVNGAQESSGQEACTCANTNTKSNTPSALSENDTEDSELSGSSSHESNIPAQSSRVYAPSMMATPAASSAAHHGVMTPPSTSSSARVATPSGADAYSPFKGAGSQVIPSLSAVAGGVLAGVVAVFATL